MEGSGFRVWDVGFRVGFYMGCRGIVLGRYRGYVGYTGLRIFLWLPSPWFKA